MSGYWCATSGTVLIIPKEEVRDFFTRYLLETYRKDGVTDRDIDFIDCTISEYGSDSFYFLRSAYRQSLLEDFHSQDRQKIQHIQIIGQPKAVLFLHLQKSGILSL